MTIKQHGGVFGRNPSFNDVEVESLTIAGNAVPDASTILVDGDIGSTVQGYDADTAKLDVAQTFSASQTFTDTVNIESADELQLAFQIGGLTYGHFRMDSADLVVGTGTTGIKFYDFATAIAPATASTGALINNSLDLGSSSFNWRSAYIGTSVIMANGAGIDFSATAGTGTSELFDDYEEGTWTPVYTTGSGAFGTITYDVQSAFYVKVGKVCVATFRMRTDSVDPGTATSLFLGGLPFTSGSSPAGSGNVAFASTFGGDFPSTVDVNPSSTAASLRYRTSVNGETLASDAADLGTGANANFFAGTIVYITA